MNHIKYNSIVNHYRKKEIEWAKKYYGDLFDKVVWGMTEKIDGANISFLFKPNEPTYHFSRNQQIHGNDFMSSEEVINRMDEQLFFIREWVETQKLSIRLFGELFGKGIQNNVNYGDEKRIMFFDVMESDQLVSQLAANTFMKNLSCSGAFVDTFRLFDTLEEALEYNVRFNSTYNDIKDNLVEGGVIKPWNYTLTDVNGTPFYLKNKNIEFAEKQKNKSKKVKTVMPEEVEKWHNTFLSYIHKSRLDSVFSKEGHIEDIKELGKFIKLIMQDSIETFWAEEEFPAEQFDKKEERYIFNGSKKIVELLKKEL